MAADPQTPSEIKPKPSIARIWRGRVTRERADEYQKYKELEMLHCPTALQPKAALYEVLIELS